MLVAIQREIIISRFRLNLLKGWDFKMQRKSFFMNLSEDYSLNFNKWLDCTVEPIAKCNCIDYIDVFF
jgi:hypothetical protein